MRLRFGLCVFQAKGRCGATEGAEEEEAGEEARGGSWSSIRIRSGPIPKWLPTELPSKEPGLSPELRSAEEGEK